MLRVRLQPESQIQDVGGVVCGWRSDMMEDQRGGGVGLKWVVEPAGIGRGGSGYCAWKVVVGGAHVRTAGSGSLTLVGVLVSSQCLRSVELARAVEATEESGRLIRLLSIKLRMRLSRRRMQL